MNNKDYKMREDFIEFLKNLQSDIINDIEVENRSDRSYGYTLVHLKIVNNKDKKLLEKEIELVVVDYQAKETRLI